MELSVKDRLYLPSFLPARGNFKDFNLKKEILRKIAIPDEVENIKSLDPLLYSKLTHQKNIRIK